VRRILFVSVFLFLLASLASAQIPTSGNVFFGYSYYNTDLSSIDRANTNGWEGSFEGKVFPFVGLVADVSGHYGSQNFGFLNAPCPSGVSSCGVFNANISEHNYLVGPRISASVGRFRPFAEALFGAGHVNANAAGSDTSFATALGGGIDYRLIRLVAWRFQGDYVQTRFFGTHQDNIRLSTGLVIRF
jgi:hypothetical protein